MNSRERLPSLLWAAASLLVISAAVALHRNLAAVAVSAPDSAPTTPAPLATSDPDDKRLEAHAAELRNRNPFRLQRTPTDRAFGAPEQLSPPSNPADSHDPNITEPTLPTLVLGGIVGGPPWKAVIEGFPGQESGVVLSVGDEWNGIRLEWIRADSAKLASTDTTWVLTLKAPWR